MATEVITIRAFRAPDEPDTCERFLTGHRKVLEDFGITNVTTNTAEWVTDADTYVIVAESDQAGIVAGIRVEMDKPGRILPIHDALYKLDPRVARSLTELGGQGNGEVCGLWNAKDYGSFGLPLLLASAAVSLANQIGAASLVCLVAHYTMRHAARAGFVRMAELGDNGMFTYPIPSIKAIAMVVPDALSLGSAPVPSRKEMISLRMRPVQELEVTTGVRPLRLRYDLRLPTALTSKTVYDSIQRDHANWKAAS